MIKFREQRSDLRFPKNYSVKLIVDNRIAYKGTTKDISNKGVFVTTKGPFSIGQALVLDFRSTTLTYEKRIGDIVRVVPDGVGILFKKPLREGFSTPLP